MLREWETCVPMYFNDCQADKGTVPGLRVLAAQYQNIDGKNFAVQGWEVIGGKTVITPGLHYCKSSRAALSVRPEELIAAKDCSTLDQIARILSASPGKERTWLSREYKSGPTRSPISRTGHR
ncbi:hypothetical protein KEM48_011716 [Puccinia striiformis f. sp. tritici PST-130]|nr:hypothetical protein KEM48_011716 [Puccinia striiformis f. sp. tritici PST-130]